MNLLSSESRDVLALAQDWCQSGKGVALATVLATWGSAPRPIGSHLVICDSGEFQGSVSGGCVEAEVITAALEVISTQTPQILEFGIADDSAWKAGLSCGGKIRVYVEPID